MAKAQPASTHHAARLHGQQALSFCVLLICGGLLALPFMVTHTPRMDSFLLIVEAAFATLALAVALLCFGRFQRKRSPALLALAGGFLFVGLTALPQLLRMSQGAFADTQLSFTTDLALPVAGIAFVLLRQAESVLEFPAARSAAFIWRAAALAVVLAALAAWLTAFGEAGEVATYPDPATPVRDALAAAFLTIANGVAIGFLWQQRRSPIDFWLIATLTAWLMAVLIQGIAPVTSLAWHLAQMYPLLGVGCVLLALLPGEPVADTLPEPERQNRPAITASTFGAIANELNQPLCAISANAEAIAGMLSDDASPQVRAALVDITEDAHRISRTLARAQDLLAGANEPPAMIDVGQLVEECLMYLRPELHEHEVVCDVETAPHLPGIRGLRKPLAQLLVNVLTSSLEAMSGLDSRERRLTVRARRHDPNAVVISVQDSGAQRSGLGLAICRSIAGAHGGDILLAPAEGRGTAIQVILPASS